MSTIALAPVDDTITIAELTRNAYPIYRRLRRETPVLRVKNVGRTMLTKWADTKAVKDNPKLFSANGLAQLLDTIDSVRQHYNPTLTVAGVIVNQHEEQTVSGRTWLDELHTAAQGRGLRVLDPPIPKRVVISDATEAARGLDEWGSAEATALSGIYADHLSAVEGDPS